MVLTALFAVDISSSLQRVTSAVLTWFDLIVRLFSWGFDWVSAGFLPSGPQVPRAQGWSWTIVFNEATSWELLAICDWSYGQGQCPLFHFVWLLVGENRFHLFFCLRFCRQHRRSLAAPGVSGSANRRPGNACNTPSGAFIRSPLGLLFSFSFAVSWYLVFRFFSFFRFFGWEGGDLGAGRPRRRKSDAGVVLGGRTRRVGWRSLFSLGFFPHSSPTKAVSLSFDRN